METNDDVGASVEPSPAANAAAATPVPPKWGRPWHPVVRWIIVAIAFVGIFTAIGFSIAFPRYLIDVIRAGRFPPDKWVLIALLQLLLRGIGGVTTMWAAWAAIERDAAAPRILRRGVMLLLITILMDVLFTLTHPQAFRPSVYGDPPPLGDFLLHTLSTTVDWAALPLFLLAIAWSRPAAAMLGGTTDDFGVAQPSSTSSPAGTFPAPITDALRHVVRATACLALAIGLPEALRVAYFTLVEHRRLGWFQLSFAGPIDIRPVAANLGFTCNDIGSLLLVVAGSAMLARKPFARRLAIGGAAMLLATKLVLDAAFYLSWQAMLLGTLIGLRRLFALVLVIALLTRSAVRRTIEADALPREPTESDVAQPPPPPRPTE
jgi:hypothetical protein